MRGSQPFQQDDAPGQQPLAQSTQPAEAAPEVRVAIEQGERYARFAVVNETGAPVADVQAFAASANDRLVRGESLASSDARGHLDIELQPDHERFTLLHPEYQPDTVAAHASAERRLVVLHAGATLSVRAHTPEGTPIAGVSVVCSNRPLPPASMLVDATRAGRALPAGKAMFAVHAGATDATGSATLRGLQQGRLFLWVDKPGYISSAYHPSPTTIPSPDIHVTMVPLYGFVWRVRGATPVGYMLPQLTNFTPPIASQMDALEKLFEQRFDADYVLAWRALGDSLPERLARAYEAGILTAEKGWVRFSARLRNLGELTAPDVIDATAAADVETGTLRLRLVSRAGVPMPLPDGTPLAWISPEGVDGRFAAIAYLMGNPLRLPVGNYDLREPGAAWRDLFRQTQFRVVAGTTTELDIELAKQLVPVRMHCVEENGIPFQMGDFGVSYLGEQRRFRKIVTDDWPARVFWLPEGDAVLSMSSNGIALGTVKLQLAPTADGSPVLVTGSAALGQ